MKKFTVIIAATAFAFAATACSGSKAENVETEAASTSASEETAAEAVEATEEAVDLPEDYEALYVEGIVKEMGSNRITVSADGTVMTFDTTNADIEGDSPVLTGSDVEVEYAEVDGDVKPAAAVTLLMDIEQQADAENRDPQIFGILSTYDINDITIVDDSGAERTFDNQMSRTVSFSELKSGDKVYISYTGSVLNDEEEAGEGAISSQPVALKVIAADALDTEDANVNYITGVIDGMDAASGKLTLMNDLTSFEVSASPEMLEGFEEEMEARVYYDGQLSGIAIDATKIEAVEG